MIMLSKRCRHRSVSPERSVAFEKSPGDKRRLETLMSVSCGHVTNNATYDTLMSKIEITALDTFLKWHFQYNKVMEKAAFIVTASSVGQAAPYRDVLDLLLPQQRLCIIVYSEKLLVAEHYASSKPFDIRLATRTRSRSAMSSTSTSRAGRTT
jgi:hypothetical protein